MGLSIKDISRSQWSKARYSLRKQLEKLAEEAQKIAEASQRKAQENTNVLPETKSA